MNCQPALFMFRVEFLKQSPMIEMNRRKSVRCHSDPGMLQTLFTATRLSHILDSGVIYKRYMLAMHMYFLRFFDTVSLWETRFSPEKLGSQTGIKNRR